MRLIRAYNSLRLSPRSRNRTSAFSKNGSAACQFFNHASLSPSASRRSASPVLPERRMPEHKRNGVNCEDLNTYSFHRQLASKDGSDLSLG